jgi:hypothetical protein
MGVITGEQANAFSDWTTVPNSRPDVSPTEASDNNYISEAPQYNVNGAVSRAPPYTLANNIPIVYLPSTTSEDYVAAALRWFSSELGLVLNPVPHGAFCSGDGCARTDMKQSTFGKFVTGASMPTLIGSKAGKDCASWWHLMTDSEMEMTGSSTVESSLDSIKKLAKALVYDGMAQKACIYKNSKWWRTPLNLSSFDFLGWGTQSRPWYQNMPYSCPALGGCSANECSAHGFDQNGGRSMICLPKSSYWSPAPVTELVGGGNSNGLVTADGGKSLDELYEIVTEELMHHVEMTLKELKLRKGGTFVLMFNPLFGFTKDKQAARATGPYGRRPHPSLYEESRLQKIKAALGPIGRGFAGGKHKVDEELDQVMQPYAKDFAKAKAVDRIASALRPYKATPWGTMKSGKQTDSDTWYPLDYRDFPLEEPVLSQTRPQGKLSLTNPQAGDLLEHAKWTALQSVLWYKAGEEWIEGVDPMLAIMGGFLLDIGKAGDCAFTCVKKLADLPEKPHIVQFVPHDDVEIPSEEHCYLDTYSPLKFDGQDNTALPELNSRYLENGRDSESVFFLKCPTEDEMREMWHTEPEGLVRHLARYKDGEFRVTAKLMRWKEAWLAGDQQDEHRGYLTAGMIRETLGLSKLDQYKFAVAMRMHWDLPRMNMDPDSPGYLDAEGYLKKFAAVMRMFSECQGDHPGLNCISGPDGKAVFQCSTSQTATLELLKLSIALSAADISAGSPSREESRRGTSEVNFVTEKTNGALKLCQEVDKVGSKAEVHGLSPAAIKLVGEICAAGCSDDEHETCALHPIYPGLDPWTAYDLDIRGLNYRAQLVSKFEEIAYGGSYNDWCATSMRDLPESPRVEYSAVLGDRIQGSEWLKLHVEVLPTTGEEFASCTANEGFVQGLCNQQKFGGCEATHDIVAPCSAPANITLQGTARSELKIPADATRYAYVYTNGIEHFNLGGFIYFDRKDKVVGVTYLTEEPAEESSGTPLSFSTPRQAPRRAYDGLRSFLEGGVKLDMPSRMEKYSRYAYIPPGVSEAMPYGGLAFLVDQSVD